MLYRLSALGWSKQWTTVNTLLLQIVCNRSSPKEVGL